MMNSIKIVLGSNNAAKLSAITRAAQHYWGDDAIVVGHDVPSNVSAQPLGHDETQQGAINRAKAAFACEPDTSIGVGMEGGVVEISGLPVLMGYVAATDGQKTVVVPTTGIAIPTTWGDALKAGAELRPLVIAAGLPYDNHTGGTAGLLTSGAFKRDEMFSGAALTVLAPWVNPAPYNSTLSLKAAS